MSRRHLQKYKMIGIVSRYGQLKRHLGRQNYHKTGKCNRAVYVYKWSLKDLEDLVGIRRQFKANIGNCKMSCRIHAKYSSFYIRQPYLHISHVIKDKFGGESG